jgi:uncharacterized membrane protein YdbT with pleckstrin-like domain
VNHTGDKAVIYQGPIRVPIGYAVACVTSLVLLVAAIFFPLLLLAAVPIALIGLSAFVYSWVVARRTCLVITEEGIKIETGLIVRSTEVVDFVRVQDVALPQMLGWETLVLHGSDVRTPHIALCFPGASKHFDDIRTAILNARRTVMALQQM